MDGRSLGDAAPRGVARYAAALLAALREAHPEDEYVVAARRPRAAYAAAALAGRPRLGAPGADVTWLPAPAPAAPARPYVVTIHDRAWERRPQDFTRYERLFHALARPRAQARHAARVIAVTRAVADDVTQAWGLERVRVVRHAPRPLPPPARPPAPPYALFVGALEPRKGPDLLAAAMPPGLELRVAGEGRIPIPGAVREGHVEDARLSTLYAGARVVVLPSRLEGFGLPVVEALAAGTPVIASDLPELREAAEGCDGVTFVPPGDVAALRAALLDPPAAPARRPRRTWDDVARETRAVLAEAAGLAG